MVHEFNHGVLKSSDTFNFFEFIKVLSAKSFYYILLYIAYFFVFYKLIFSHFSLSFNGSIFLHLLLSLFFIAAVIVYTILFTSFFKTTIGWTEVMAFSTYPLFLVSGYSWPIDAMPKGLQIFANLLPSTPYFKIFNSLATEGANLDNINLDFIHLLALLLVGYSLLYLRFRVIKFKSSKQVKDSLAFSELN
jgi:ABC-2 type transport system permease protein